jgi:hypothetical protein
MAAGGFKGQPVCSDFSSDPAARCNLVVQNGSWNFSGWSPPKFLAAPSAILAAAGASREGRDPVSLQDGRLRAGADRPFRISN